MAKWNVDKYRRICDEAAAAHAVILRKSEDIQHERNTKLRDASIRLREAQNAGHMGHVEYEVGDPRLRRNSYGGTTSERDRVREDARTVHIEHYGKLVAESEARIARLTREHDAAAERWQPLAALKERLTRFLEDHGIANPGEAL